MAWDKDTAVIGLHTPSPLIAPATVRPAVTVANLGRVDAVGSGTLRIYNEATGLLIFSTTVLTTTIPPGAERLAHASDYWTPPGIGKYIVIAHVTSAGDQNKKNDYLSPTKVEVADIPPPPPPIVPAHSAQHERDEVDELNVDGLRGRLAETQIPVEHASSHTDGGHDQLSVEGLHGQLADPQPAGPHDNAQHTTPYQPTSEKGAANGYAPLSAISRVPPYNMGGTPGPGSLLYLHSSGVWRAVEAMPDPPGPFELSSPAPYATEQPLSGTLRWFTSARAVSYDVWLYKEGDPHRLIAAGLEALECPYFALETGKRYVWYVVARNAAGAFTSIARMFDTIGERPAVPQLLYPPNYARDTPRILNAAWAPATRATTYDVYLGDYEPGNMILVYEDVEQPPVSFYGLAAERDYFWKVVAKNEHGATASEIWTFRTGVELPDPPESPLLRDPDNNASHVPASPVYQWYHARRATAYDLYLRDRADPEAPFVKIGENLTATQFEDGPVLLAEHFYQWKVVAKNEYGETSSAVWLFLTELAPQPPILTFPLDQARVPAGTVRLEWTVEHTWYLSGFDVYCTPKLTDPPIRVATDLPKTARHFDVPDRLPESEYYWSVVSKGPGGEMASVTRDFTCGPLPPDEPWLLEPDNESSFWDDSPWLRWRKFGGPGQVTDVYLDSGAGEVKIAENLEGEEHQLHDLPRDVWYHWRVVCRNESGEASSLVYSFYIYGP